MERLSQAIRSPNCRVSALVSMIFMDICFDVEFVISYGFEPYQNMNLKLILTL